MKLRLIFRDGVADSEGRLAEYKYYTDVVEFPNETKVLGCEIIGGEWLREEAKKCKKD